MIIQIAWKNIWRNKTRSLIVISSVAVGVFAGVFAMAAINSSVVQRIDAAVNEELSHIQVNSREFRSSSDIQDLIPGFNEADSALKSLPGVKTTTGRIIIRGIASTSAKSSGVEINGIDVEKEKEMFTLNNKVIPGTGSYFGSDTKFNSVLIGEKLAKDLNIIRYILTPEAVARLDSLKIPSRVLSKLETISGERFTSDKKFNSELEKLLTSDETGKYAIHIKEAAWSYREGAKLILTFLDMDNNQTGAGFRVCGIFRTNNDMFEGMSVFVPARELRALTGMKEETWHRIIARLDNDDLTDKITEPARKALPDLEVLNWKEISPDLAMIADFMGQIYAVFMVIILAALAFGIVNTMLMAVLERTKELGMLGAIGMNRKKIFSMIMYESIFMSVVGGFAGMGIAEAVIAATQKNGINLIKYSEGMEAFGYSAHLFPTIDAGFFVSTTILIVLTGILASIYPARKALKLNPVEAIRTE
ncbi:MAG: FtsX-like permease family protein [Bacteroidales bacterium]|jgi:ABC-type lipoprotein release transport system permease subunit|nr:FtsX-like permease family protein [Bacteroidales bacterium]